MDKKPLVRKLEDGSKLWEASFDTFNATVLVPPTTLPEDLINFGYASPYLLVLEEEPVPAEMAKEHAMKSGLFEAASQSATSVVFISPKSGWENADEELFKELILNSKIHQYHEDGMAVLVNRFTKSTDGYAIRGAIFRTMLFAHGSAADYVAGHLLKTIDGMGLWGPADVTPAVCILEGLSVIPDIKRDDIPIVSIGNNDEINEAIKKAAKHSFIKEKLSSKEAYEQFAWKFFRWVGALQDTVDFEALSMVKETGRVKVSTTPENEGDYKGSEHHEIGYVAYYNKSLFDEGPAPLVLAFHGGGDSAMHIAEVSEWYKVAKDHDFLLICVEDHLNSTAGETMELIAHICDRYNVDGERIYGTGFSMGGCKSWDLFQEYPEIFAGLAPMSATFEVGLNVYGKEAPVEINREVMVPVFYVGGAISPLPELPFQAEKCRDRMEHILTTNGCTKEYKVKFEEKDNWEEKIFGIHGDVTVNIDDPSRGSVLTLEQFKSGDGNIYTSFGSVSGQGHECRYHSCENAWLFLSRFKRNLNGEIEIDK